MIRSTSLLLILLASSLTGCLGLFGDDDVEELQEDSFEEIVGNQTAQEVAELAGNVFRNFIVPDQEVRETVELVVEGQVGTNEGTTSIEDRNDRSGTKYRDVIKVEDLSSHIPPGQPAEIAVKMYYAGQAGSSADLDLYVDVPGFQTDYAADNGDEFSWKYDVQELTLNTVGVSGQPMEVGVQVSNGRVLTQPLEYTLEIEIRYAKDVITPYQPWAVNVPEDATGLVLKSEKAGGAEHIRATILVITPEDELLEVVHYDDIGLPTESFRVPTPGPGEYILHVVNITGGFLGVETDVPLDEEQREMYPVDRIEEDVVDFDGPAPGWSDHYDAGTPEQCDQKTQFDLSGTFPLAITPWIRGENAAEANVKTTITGPNGLVAELKRFGKVETTDGQIGLSRDENNLVFDPTKLAKGAYEVCVINDGNAAVGHTLVTYRR